MNNQKTETSGYRIPLIVMTSLFFMWGFITCMNDILIPYLKGVFDLSHFRAMLVQFSFFGAYFIGSLIYFIFSALYGDPINKIGYRYGIIGGLILSAIGCALFYPAAEFVSFPFFLSALFILGLGFTLLQISANPYVAILGSPEGASGRLNLSQAFNSLGTTIAPIIGGYLIFKYFAGAEYTGADSVKIPYLIFATIFILLAIFFRFVHLPDFSNQQKVSKGLSVLKHKSLRYGMGAIFMYVGAEVCIGSILISYLKTDNIAGLDENHASMFVAFYWGGLMIGRFIGGISLSSFKNSSAKWGLIAASAILTTTLIMSIAHFKNGLTLSQMWPYAAFVVLQLCAFVIGRNRPARTLFVFSIIIQILLVTTMLTNGSVAMWTVIAAGLFNSIMWSNIFTLAIKNLGDQTSQGSSLLIMMIVGGALLPLIQGYIADVSSIQISFIIPLVGYAYISLYSLWGYKERA